MDKLPETDSPESILKRRSMLDECKQKVLDILKTTVRPEFLNRIDEIIMFDPLTKNDIREILHLQMDELKKRLSEDNIELSFTNKFEDFMIDKGYDPAYGARPIKRVMQRELINKLAKSILEGKLNKDSAIVVDVADNDVVLRNK